MGADKLPDPVAQAIAAAQALRGSEGRAKGVDSLVDDLAELDMEHYDDEDEGEDAGMWGSKLRVINDTAKHSISCLGHLT